ncbi:hypothetical protein Tco_0903483 [Tanacetum coccineum]
MEPEFHTETASSKVVHAFSPVVADSYHIVHKSSSHTQIKLNSNNIIRRQVEEPVVEVDMSSTLLGRVLNMEQIGKVIGFVVVVVTQMSGSSKNLKNHSLCLLGAILVVYAMKQWVMPYCKVKWKVIRNRFHVYKVTMFLSTYLYAQTRVAQLVWVCHSIMKKGVLVINYVVDKVLNPKCKDQASSCMPYRSDN